MVDSGVKLPPGTDWRELWSELDGHINGLVVGLAGDEHGFINVGRGARPCAETSAAGKDPDNMTFYLASARRRPHSVVLPGGVGTVACCVGGTCSVRRDDYDIDVALRRVRTLCGVRLDRVRMV